MKKLTLCIATVMLLFTLIPLQLKAGTDNEPAVETTTVTVETSEADIIVARLEEIKEMDKSDLTSAEKKELRKEVRTLKSDLKALDGGLYISVGAAILIVLILILIL